MSKAADLTAIYIGKDLEGAQKGIVTDPGWYAVDDSHVATMGPFDTKRECEKAIQRLIDSGL